MDEPQKNTGMRGSPARITGLFASLLLSLVISLPATSLAQESASVVFLVRHAEMETGSNPPLSVAGNQRAKRLASLLADAGIQHIHSTDYLRTRETAAPVADRLGLEVRLYDPRKLEGFAQALKQAGGRHLVVGHSNTTPDLARFLGGDPGTEIDEPGEYDRLYVISIVDDQVLSTLLRYGTPFVIP